MPATPWMPSMMATAYSFVDSSFSALSELFSQDDLLLFPRHDNGTFPDLPGIGNRAFFQDIRIHLRIENSPDLFRVLRTNSLTVTVRYQQGRFQIPKVRQNSLCKFRNAMKSKTHFRIGCKGVHNRFRRVNIFKTEKALLLLKLLRELFDSPDQFLLLFKMALAHHLTILEKILRDCNLTVFFQKVIYKFVPHLPAFQIGDERKVYNDAFILLKQWSDQSSAPFITEVG